MKYMAASLLALFLASCSNNEAQIISPTQTESIVVSETQTPIQDISTTVATSVIYDFPSWITNPDTTILAALIRDDITKSRGILFLNAATGEKFEIQAPPNSDAFFWHDNMHFGVIDKDSNTELIFELGTGQVATQPAPPEPPVVSWKTQFSVNKQYRAEWDSNDKVITVANAETNDVIWELALPENRYGTEIIWSPINESQLAYLYGSPSIGGQITQNMTLSIVDTATGEILSTFSGDFGVLAWSPNGKMILYLSPWFRYRLYGIPFRDAPCLLILATGEQKCLRSIHQLVPPEYNLSTTSAYSWAEDSNSIFFTYQYTSPVHEPLGNLCNYSLVNSHITCPTQNLDIMKGRSVVSYDLSPDKQFIHFCYSDSSPLSDASGTTNDGMIRIDGSGFFSWVGTILDGGPLEACSVTTAWRPLP